MLCASEDIQYFALLMNILWNALRFSLPVDQLCEDILVIFQINASAIASVIIQLADLCLFFALVIWRTSVFVTFTNKRVSVLWQLENEDKLVISLNTLAIALALVWKMSHMSSHNNQRDI